MRQSARQQSDRDVIALAMPEFTLDGAGAPFCQRHVEKLLHLVFQFLRNKRHDIGINGPRRFQPENPYQIPIKVGHPAVLCNRTKPDRRSFKNGARPVPAHLQIAQRLLLVLERGLNGSTMSL